ncbi:imidazole glycerol phosphate synthase subunit HisH [Listeria seeligeri]|uniref:imidazole glycerol phosphate synthase subunit HisH n=1 Tax=Listeria seeligeri TaxID=1640 RepID=UPI0022EB485D|nr:imidazole glycerol phosphate synthase subunit HisH [Listeria seeligeri]
MIVIVDYDTGNTKSIRKALDFIGLPNKISSNKKDIKAADGIILPGVGAFPEAMQELIQRGLDTTLKEVAATGKPFLGVCLGMQLLLDSSNEHSLTKGLGLIPGQVEKLPDEPKFAVPHMGWNQLNIHQTTPLTTNLEGEYVYYVHSYYANCPKKYIIATSSYSVEIPSMINNGNIYGAQFHPEKSGEIGLRILTGFKEVIETCKSSQQSI